MENSKELYENLRQHFGSHTKAALALGISARQYRALRNGGKQKTSERLKKMVQLFYSSCDFVPYKR